MNALRKPKKYEIIYDLCDVVALINSDPSFIADDETFWNAVEKLCRAMALIDSLPGNVIEEELASKRCLASFNGFMADWADSICPPGGWSNDLLARIPAADTRDRIPDLNIF